MKKVKRKYYYPEKVKQLQKDLDEAALMYDELLKENKEHTNSVREMSSKFASYEGMAQAAKTSEALAIADKNKLAAELKAIREYSTDLVLRIKSHDHY